VILSSREAGANQTQGGFDDGEEVLVMGTDPLDPLDPEPDPVPEPASWLMLVAGTVFLALLYRRSVRELRLG
jgi:hypothetical protein